MNKDKNTKQAKPKLWSRLKRWLYNFRFKSYWRREYLFHWIVRDIFNYPEGERLNKPLIFLRFILMPMNTIFHITYKNLSCYDPFSDTFNIYGVRYTGGLFRGLGFFGYKEGQKFKIIKRESGYITIEKVV